MKKQLFQWGGGGKLTLTALSYRLIVAAALAATTYACTKADALVDKSIKSSENKVAMVNLKTPPLPNGSTPTASVNAVIPPIGIISAEACEVNCLPTNPTNPSPPLPNPNALGSIYGPYCYLVTIQQDQSWPSGLTLKQPGNPINPNVKVRVRFYNTNNPSILHNPLYPYYTNPASYINIANYTTGLPPNTKQIFNTPPVSSSGTTTFYISTAFQLSGNNSYIRLEYYDPTSPAYPYAFRPCAAPAYKLTVFGKGMC